MQQTTEPLFRELDRLRTIFTPLCERLADADKQFRNSALPLPEGLVSDLADFKKSLGDSGDRVLGFSKKLSLSIDLPVADLEDLNRSLHTIAKIEEQRANAAVQENALAVLERALGVVRRDRSIHPPLLNCQAKARKLRDEIMRSAGSELHPEARKLSEGSHVISRLLDLIERQSDLADDEYLRFQHLVGESFGDELAIAAARGKLKRSR